MKTTSFQGELGASKNLERTLKQYEKRVGVIVGYLPKDIKCIGKWLSKLVEDSRKEKETAGRKYVMAPSILEMKAMLNKSKYLEKEVATMIKEAMAIHREYEPDINDCIKSVDDLYVAMNYVLHHAPSFRPDVCHTAYPMSGIFVYMMATPSGWNVFRSDAFNDSLRKILQAWCFFLSSEESLSVVTTAPNGWLSSASVVANNLDQFVSTDDKIKDPVHWGYTSFNDFFHRQIIKKCRPIDGLDEDAVIISANDGTVSRLARNVSLTDSFELKSQNYSLNNMLNESPYTELFNGGDVLQSFLGPQDYHRWCAPISGEVVEARVINAYMFSELRVENWDVSGDTKSQSYEANVNTRGLIIIKSRDPNIGMVAVMPIGITEISSVKIEVSKGDYLRKGDELGWFSYGGSSLCLIFQANAVKQFTVVDPDIDINSDNGPFVRARAQVAIANTSIKRLIKPID